MIKKTAVQEFGNPRRTGIAAIGLGKGDRLIDVKLTDGSQDVVIGTRAGIAIRFHESEVRSMGRTASGVRAIKLGKGDRVIGSVVLRRKGTSILVATASGYGKRSETEEYRVSHRGGKGIITVRTSEKTGQMVAIREVVDSDDIVVITTSGIVIRQHAKEVRVAGRNTQGVRLIRLGSGDSISDVTAVVSEDEDPEVVVAAQTGGDTGGANGGKPVRNNRDKKTPAPPEAPAQEEKEKKPSPGLKKKQEPNAGSKGGKKK
jgi:DNA gyrase subunit A